MTLVDAAVTSGHPTHSLDVKPVRTYRIATKDGVKWEVQADQINISATDVMMFAREGRTVAVADLSWCLVMEVSG